MIGVVLTATLMSYATTGRDPYFIKMKSAANVYVAPIPADVLKVATLPFRAPTELIGSSVSDMIVTELLRTKRYILVERSQMANVLSETELARAGLSQARAVEVAKMLGADGVVIGTVDEYGTQAQGGKTYAVVGVSIRLVSARSGQILWSADLAKRATDPNTPLSAHARTVVHELVSGLYQKWGAQRTVANMEILVNPNVPVKYSTPASADTGVSEELPTPSPPSGLTASDKGLRSVTLTWKPPQDSLISSYRIERAVTPDGPFVSVGETAPSKGVYTDRSGLLDGETYYYRIVALSRYETTSAPSSIAESMTAPPPDPPPR